jgi:hypothetical protein
LGAAVWWTAARFDLLGTRARKVAILSIVAVPLLSGLGLDAATRSFIEHHYGLPLLHDSSEGEYPKLIAAIRGIESKKDNRYVMVTQERLAKLRKEVPRLIPVIDRLQLPGPSTFACLYIRVCTELANGWVLFWIKDAAWEAGLTPTLPEAQKFFRAARVDIERACGEGRLKCTPNGSGLFPPFELKWTRAFVREFLGILAMAAAPNPYLLATAPERYDVDTNFGRMVQFVTMTPDFDAAANAVRETTARPRYVSPLSNWRESIGDLYKLFAAALSLLTMAAVVVRIALWRSVSPNAISILTAIFTGYTVIRLMAISYVGIYYGHELGDRFMYSTHSFLLLISFLAIADATNAARVARTRGLANG